MGQAKRRGTYEERRALASGHVYDPATKTLTPAPIGIVAVDDIHRFPRRRPLMAATLAMMAVGAWPDRSLFRNDRWPHT